MSFEALAQLVPEEIYERVIRILARCIIGGKNMKCSICGSDEVVCMKLVYDMNADDGTELTYLIFRCKEHMKTK